MFRYSITSKCYQISRAICGLRDNLEGTYLHKKLVEQLEYGMRGGGESLYYTNLKSLILTQNQIIRIMSRKAKIEHAVPLFKNINILSDKILYVCKVLYILFNIVGNRMSYWVSRRGTLSNKLKVNVLKHISQFQKYIFANDEIF